MEPAQVTSALIGVGDDAVGLFLLGRSVPRERTGRGRRHSDFGKSIAVLPLVNQSGDPAQEYFSDGLTEELINGLGQIPELRVIGRNSSFHLKGKGGDSRAIGQALGVAHLLEGSVRKMGDRVRIGVQLVNAADGSQRWSDTYNRELERYLRRAGGDRESGRGAVARQAARAMRRPLPQSRAIRISPPTMLFFRRNINSKRQTCPVGRQH